jgi:predicted RNase H-like HicB family nuclease
MSVRSKKSSPKRSSYARLDRPFAASLLKRAGEIASRYRLVLEAEAELGYMGTSIEMPRVWGDGKTPDLCVRSIREALISAIATMLEKGESPPMPSNEDLRTEQINIRVTPQERLVLEEAARTKGFRGISDFVRTTTLAQAS